MATMAALPRLMRSVHTSAVRLDAAAAALAIPTTLTAAQAANAAGLPVTRAMAAAASPAPVTFTPKGRPVIVRPPRTTRVNLPSGFPEPLAYPPSKEYLDEVRRIMDDLPPEQAHPPRHPLWSFFHVPARSAAPLREGDTMQDMGSVERLGDEGTSKSGRSWRASELRRKSFEDLHTLWYVLLRERNVMATQKDERRRLQIISSYGGPVIAKRAMRCRKSMARIKATINERRLAIAAAAAPTKAPYVHVPGPVPGYLDESAYIDTSIVGVDVAPLLKQLANLPKARGRTASTKPNTARSERDEARRRRTAKIVAHHRAMVEKRAAYRAANPEKVAAQRAERRDARQAVKLSLLSPEDIKRKEARRAVIGQAMKEAHAVQKKVQDAAAVKAAQSAAQAKAAWKAKDAKRKAQRDAHRAQKFGQSKPVEA